MHPTVLTFVGGEITAVSPGAYRDVLEVGSYDVNGTVRPLFALAETYVGVDVVPGPGVDLVYDGLTLPFEAESFDVVVSTEMLEHCERPWQAIQEMRRVVRPGGLVLVTARGWVVTRRWTESNGVEVGEVATFGFHNPPDLWRFSDGAMRAMAEAAGLVEIVVQQDGLVPGWFMAARKP